MTSLRWALGEGGVQVDSKFSLRNDLQCLPSSGSLGTIINSLRDARLSEWVKHETVFEDKTWTQECQGVATDGVSWYFTSNDDGDPAVYKFDASLRSLLAKRPIPRSIAGHVGDVDVRDDRVYVALEQPTQLVVLGSTLEERHQHVLPVETPDGHFAWCGENPWNGLLYTSAWNEADTLLAYDIRGDEVRRMPADDIALSASVDRVQGGAFSPNGRVYLASDGQLGRAGIWAFSVATGRLSGQVPITIHHGAPKFEEAEGVGFGLMHTFGAATYVHLVLLDTWDHDSPDDIFLKSYEVPDPSLV